MGLMLDYNFLWNVLHYPAGIVPVTRVKKDEETMPDDGYNDFWTGCLNKDAKGSEGMPICVQVIGHAFEDEKVLGVMQAIENKIKYRCKVPEKL